MHADSTAGATCIRSTQAALGPWAYLIVTPCDLARSRLPDRSGRKERPDLNARRSDLRVSRGSLPSRGQFRLTAVMREGPLEITDLLWPTSDGGELIPVRRSEAVAALEFRGQHRAAALVASMPYANDLIDDSYLHDLAIRIHRELQRLGEELQLDRRISALLDPSIRRLMTASPEPVTVLDVGCGLGHVLRSAAAHKHLPAGVELVGVDLNPVLIDDARRLAAIEKLNVRFEHADAFDVAALGLDPSRTIVISSGLLHHFSEEDLSGFFAAQASAGFAGFAHFDIAPCVWSTLGAWVFHQARMREPVSRHDGVMSARRAHQVEVLLSSAQIGAPEYAPAVLHGGRWYPRALDVLRPIVGWR